MICHHPHAVICSYRKWLFRATRRLFIDTFHSLHGSTRQALHPCLSCLIMLKKLLWANNICAREPLGVVTRVTDFTKILDFWQVLMLEAMTFCYSKCEPSVYRSAGCHGSSETMKCCSCCTVPLVLLLIRIKPSFTTDSNLFNSLNGRKIAQKAIVYSISQPTVHDTSEHCA